MEGFAEKNIKTNKTSHEIQNMGDHFLFIIHITTIYVSNEMVFP